MTDDLTDNSTTTATPPKCKKPANTNSLINLPASGFLNDETCHANQVYNEQLTAWMEKTAQQCPLNDETPLDEIPVIRQRQAELFYASPVYTNFTKRYAVEIEKVEIGGVSVEVFTPSEGIAAKNKNRVLINMHGGGFMMGAGTFSRQESIPIAELGKIKVISVDYRMAPAHTHPAARDDLIAVYKALLIDYTQEQIGLYGCSAGAMIIAQAIALLPQLDIPKPAAIGLLCGAPHPWHKGDAASFVGAIQNAPIPGPADYPYFDGQDCNDAGVFPGNDETLLAAFPPTLLLSSTRDFCMSSVIVTHAQLVKLHREAELHIWEGLEHAFIYNPELQESREAYEVIVGFFDRQLGHSVDMER